MRRLALFLVVLSLTSMSAAKDEFQVAEFLKQHLNSIGTDQARAAVKNCLVQGTVTFQILNRAAQTWEGPATFVSEGNKMSSLFKFPPTVYRTEWFTSDGTRASVAFVRPGHWTEFGNFVKVHDEILTQGLWGGTLSTAWALAHVEERDAKLQDRGTKKIDGIELHRVDYVPKKNSDLEIQLYFEPNTFRHVMTVYLLTISARSAPTVNQARNESETHYRLEERFSEFTSFDSLTLPTRWTVRFTYGGVSNGIIDQYDVTAKKISHNISLDAKNFEVK
jgi:hypothetical protein